LLIGHVVDVFFKAGDIASLFLMRDAMCAKIEVGIFYTVFTGKNSIIYLLYFPGNKIMGRYSCDSINGLTNFGEEMT